MLAILQFAHKLKNFTPELPRTTLGTGPEAAQADRALETCDGKGNAPSWSDVLDRFIEYSREVNGACTHGPNMTEHTFEVRRRANQDGHPSGG